jgi:hypothetical protein
MTKIIKQLWYCFALSSVTNFFNDDCHHIVSKRGWEILNERYNHSK